MTRIRCPRLCGRDAELDVLIEAVRGGGMVVLNGPAGIGKSRLVAEAAAVAELEGLTVATGRAAPASAAQPYAPVRNALLQLLRAGPLPDDEGFAGWKATLAPVLPGHLAEAEQVDAQPALVGEALTQLLDRLPTRVLLVFEDLHWADADTIAMLDYVADAAAGRPTAWLLTTRGTPEFVDRFRERRSVRTIFPGPLPPAAISEMVRACAPDGDDAELIARAQRYSDGVPLYIEELVASPGIPETFVEAVRARWAALSDDERAVLGAAAVLGREFPVDLLVVLAARAAPQIERAIAAGIDAGLLERRVGETRFRHALTREAVLDTLSPPDRRQLALAALDAVRNAQPDGWQGLAADLALSAGDRRRAGELLALAGEAALQRGALGTAVDSLRRAVELSDGENTTARLALIRALSASGQIDAALSEGAAMLNAGGEPDARLRLLLAEVAARGSRWQLAAQHLAGVHGAPGLAERTDVLAAEIAFASGDTDAARSRVTALLQLQPADTAVRIRAHILLGRIDRLTDLSAARDSFESALAIAQATRLPVHVLDALHELGTIELLDFGGTSRLLEARAVAARLGAMGTLAVIDLQLTAGFLSHLDTDAAERHSRSAHEIADRLGLHLVAAKAQCEMAEVFVQRRQSAEMERLLGLAMARIPDDRFTEAFAWGQCRGLLALFEGDWTRALACLERGMALLHGVANPEPVEFRAFWPLLLAHFGDERAEGALEEADATNLTVAFANRGFLGYARAILAGRAGDRAAAEDIALRADAYFVRFPFWGALARLCSAPAAEQDGWGRPQQWLAAAAETFREFGYEALAERCGPRQRPEVTEREGDVLALVAKGLSNKEIAAQLHLSSRTVEKHVESLLRKTGRRSRTQLALWAEGRNT